MRQQSDGIKGTYSSGSSLNWLGSESFVFQKWYLYVLFVRLEETKCLEEISARTNFTISLSWSTFLRDCFGQPSTIPWIENPALYKMYQYILKICRSTSFVSDFSQTRPFNFFSPPHFTHLFSGLHGTSKLDKLDTASELFTRAASVSGSCFWVVCQSPIQRQSCFHRYPLVNVYITMENHHVIAGKIHYFYGHVQ
jgi:hypothetical protein